MSGSTATTIENHFTAWMENDNDPTISNKIHAADGARQYGFKSALVGGVTVYGWCVPTIMQAAGESWLDNGWAEIHFRRPTYPGDEMTIRATQVEQQWDLAVEKQTGETCIRGSFGLGDAPWLDMFDVSTIREASPEPEKKVFLTLDNAPIGKELLTMPFNASPEETREIATDKLREKNPLFLGDAPLVHPMTLARQMISLLAYTFDYGRPSIHASSHIQHRGRVAAGEPLVVTGRLIDAYERNGHHYAVTDGVFLAEDGREVARIRHTNIITVAKRDNA